MKKIIALVFLILFIPSVNADGYDVSVTLSNKDKTTLTYTELGEVKHKISTDKKEETTNEYGKFIVGDNTTVEFNKGVLKLQGGTINELDIYFDGVHYVIRDYKLGSNTLFINNSEELKVTVNETGKEEVVEFNICEEKDEAYCYTTKLDIEKETEVTTNDEIPMKKTTYYEYMIPFGVLIVIGIVIIINSKRRK